MPLPAADISHATPLGEMTGVVLGGFTTLDILAARLGPRQGDRPRHGAAGDLAEAVVGFAHQTITDQPPTRYRPAIAADPGAGATARLVGDLGRHACTTSVRIDAAP